MHRAGTINIKITTLRNEGSERGERSGRSVKLDRGTDERKRRTPAEEWLRRSTPAAASSGQLRARRVMRAPTFEHEWRASLPLPFEGRGDSRRRRSRVECRAPIEHDWQIPGRIDLAAKRSAAQQLSAQRARVGSTVAGRHDASREEPRTDRSAAPRLRPPEPTRLGGAASHGKSEDSSSNARTREYRAWPLDATGCALERPNNSIIKRSE